MTEHEQPDRFEHRMERTFQTTATPEEAWEAIATADGIAAWMAPTRLDPRTGGAVSFDVGSWSHGIVTDYTPSTRFAYSEPWPMAKEMRDWIATTSDHEVTEGDLSAITPIATEFLVESASGGSCVIRVVSSAYGTGAEWEREFFAEMVQGWAALLDNLVTHLQRGHQ